MMAIRPALPADAGALAELRYEFRASIGEPTETREAFLKRCSEWMARTLASGEWRAWVAERDGALVGSIWLQLIEKIPNPIDERERHAYLSNLYVRPVARGGAGTQLLEVALSWVDESGVDRVVLWPTARSRSLYGRYGFQPQLDVMERKRP